MMTKYIKYIAVLALGMVACEPEFDNPIEDQTLSTSGEADFSTYVALGNSLTAGFADNALYISGQENSFPNILAQRFSFAGGGEFNQPLMADNVGGLLSGGSPILDPATGERQFGPRLVLAFDANGSPGPAPYTGAASTTDVNTMLSGSYNNMGVPGAKSYHLVAPGYGNPAGLAVSPPASNPYFVRFASSANTTVLADALAQNPTFFSLWIGNNDILSYATSGGVGVDHNETGNIEPSTYGSEDITNNNVFAQLYSDMVTGLTANGAAGVLINIPDVTSIPFFTTVPNKALVLDAQQAANLTGFFQAFAGIATSVLASPPNNIPLPQAQAIASQYAITFNEGPNRFLIEEESPTNPFGFRQMTEEELLLLTIDQTALAQGYGSVVLTPEVLQILGLLQMGGTPTPEQGALVIEAVNAIDDKDVLDSTELNAINNARKSYNNTIKNLAQANGLAFFDASASLKEIAEGGISFNGGVVTDTFASGGGFSLDGVHPTPRGHAIIANRIMDAIETTYDADLLKVDPGTYGTITLSNEVSSN